MKRILTGLSAIAVWATSLAAQPAPLTPADITGVWRHHTFYYEFTGAGTMNEVQIEGDPVHYSAYRFEIVTGTAPPLIRYGKDMADSAAASYLLVTDMADSTATIAAGIPFARSGGGMGLRGTWTHADDLTLIVWTFGTGTVSYTQQVLDLTDGSLVETEHHEGTFTRGTRENAGRFFLTFDDGTAATVYPLIAGDIMYLFDLTGRRSKFVRAPGAPSYSDFKDAQASGMQNGNATR